MNTYEKIQIDGNSGEEILNENQLRNRKKKLKKFLEKRDAVEDSDPELDLKVKKLESMIWEYEHQHNLHKEEQDQDQEEKKEVDEMKKMKQTKNSRNAKKRKKKRENEFLEREFQKNKDYWAKYEKEQKEKERLRKEEEQKKREEKERRKEERKAEEEKWRRSQSDQGDQDEEPRSKEKLFGECEIEEIPDDLSELYDNYDKKMYKELALKYHPDKSDYHVGYIKSVNRIKDIHNPRIVRNDETWTK